MTLKNLCDSISSIEIESDLEQYKFIIDPKKRPKKIWDFIISLLIFYSVFMDPIRLTFRELDNETYIYFDCIVDLFFLIDLILNFFIPFYEKGILVKNSKRIIANYLAKWFLFDLLSSLPFSFVIVIFNNIQEDNSLSSFKSFLRFSRIYRLLKWTTILRLMKFAKRKTNANELDQDQGNGSVRMLTFTFFLIVILHICTCLWIYIGIPSTTQNFTWIHFHQLQDSQPFEIYIASLYFNLVTMFTIGYGDIRPYTMIERIYNCFFLSVGGAAGPMLTL